MGLSANEVEKLGSLKSDGPDVVKDVGLEDASYAPQTGMEYSQLYGSPYQVQQPGMDYYKSFEPVASAAPPPAATPEPYTPPPGAVPPNPGMGYFGTYGSGTVLPEPTGPMVNAEGVPIEFDYAEGTEPGSGNTRDGQENQFGDYTTYYKEVGAPSAFVPEITSSNESLINIPGATNQPLRGPGSAGSLLGKPPEESPNLIPGLIADLPIKTKPIRRPRPIGGGGKRKRK